MEGKESIRAGKESIRARFIIDIMGKPKEMVLKALKEKEGKKKS